MRNSKARKWIILSLVCLAIALPSYVEYQLTPLAPNIIKMLHLTPSQFISIFSAPMIPSIFFSFVIGGFVDKYGPKMVVALGLLISVLGTCLRLTANNYITLLIYMVMVGFSATFVNGSAAKIIGGWFPPEKINTMMGIYFAVSSLAMAVGTGTTAFFSSVRSAYIFAAVIMVIFFVCWLIGMKNPAVSTTEKEASSSQEKIPFSSSMKVVVKSKTVWIVGLCMFAIMGGALALVSLLPNALAGRGISTAAAGVYASMVTFGGIAGSLTVPVITNKIGRTKPVLFVVGIISALGCAFAWQLPQGILLGTALFLTGYLYMGTFPLITSIPICIKEIGPVYAGTAGGLVATLQLIGAVVVPTYVVATIAGNNMHLFFILAGIFMVLFSVLTIFLPELGPKGNK